MSDLLKDKLRYRMFPEIKDWTGPQDELRNTHSNDQDLWHFVWFNPLAYTIMKFALPGNLMFWSCVFAVKNAKYGLSWQLGIPLVLFIYGLVWLFKETNKININMQTNMYDILMKDKK